MAEQIGAAWAILEAATGTEEVRVELDRSEASLPAVIHAIACASRMPKPGRTLAREIVWRPAE
jgi:hypothetical protein